MGNISTIPALAPRTDNNFMRTFTGRHYWPLNPRPEDVCIEDIAHHLSLVNRFTGATFQPYSVAEHSLRVSWLVEEKMSHAGVNERELRDAALWGLLHDAPEAYLNDLARPFKHSEAMATYRAIEEVNASLLALVFGLSWPMPPVVKYADDVLCRTEMRDLLLNPSRSSGDRLPSTIFPLDWQEAERQFLRRFYELGGVCCGGANAKKPNQ